MHRKWIHLASTFAIALAAVGVQAADPAPASVPQYKLLKTIATGTTGRWDYLCVDSDARRLYIPRSSHVQVLDLDKGTVLGDIPDTNGVHGVALAPDQQLGFISCGKDNSVAVFDLKTFKVSHTIKVGTHPDAILYDPASKHILAMNHSSGDISVIDPAALDKEPVKITVGGTLEYAVSDDAGHVFVNVEDKSELVEIDTKANTVLAHWPLAPGEEPTGLAIDVAHHRLFAGCANQKMIVIDSENGKKLADVPIGKGVDGVAFDPASGVAVSANGKDGTISVVRETSPGKFEAVQTAKTLAGARTIVVDTKTHNLLMPTNEADGKTFVIAVVGAEEAKH